MATALSGLSLSSVCAGDDWTQVKNLPTDDSAVGASWGWAERLLVAVLRAQVKNLPTGDIPSTKAVFRSTKRAAQALNGDDPRGTAREMFVLLK